MRRGFLLAVLFAVSLSARAQFSRGDFSLTTATGQAVAGAEVFVLSQPANTATFTPTVALFGSPTGGGTALCGNSAGQISNPLTTDQFGHACAYVSPGTYTVCYVSPRVGTQCYPDQAYNGPSTSSAVLPFWFDVRTYGAKVDGATDDTTAVNLAVAAATAAGGGIVFIPAGVMVTQPIQGASGVGFNGAGNSQTTWKLIANGVPVAPSGSGTCSTTASVVIECYTSAWNISNLTIDGNLSSQTAATAHGIYVSAHNYTPTSKTPPSIQNVTVQFAKTDGIHIDFGSAGQGIHSHITVYGVGGIGILAGSFDTFWTDINVGQSGAQGFWASESAQHITTLKSWFSGAVTPSAGMGFISTAGDVQCDSCEAQDNQANGFYLDGATNNVLTGIKAAGNNRTSGTTGNGVEIFNATGNVVVGSSQGGADFSPSQLWAVRFDGSSANNIVRLTSANNVTGKVGGTATNEDVMDLDADGTATSNILGTVITTTGPITSSAYVGSISSSTTAFQSVRIQNGTNAWFPTVKGSSGWFGLQDESTLNYPFEVQEGSPDGAFIVTPSGVALNGTGATVADYHAGTAATRTPGTNVAAVNCSSTICNTARGNLSISGGTATTGTIATIAFTDSPTSTLTCAVHQESGATWFGIGHSISGTTLTITAAVSVSGATIPVSYTCSQ